jgi:hypothetical protein
MNASQHRLTGYIWIQQIVGCCEMKNGSGRLAVYTAKTVIGSALEAEAIYS